MRGGGSLGVVQSCTRCAPSKSGGQRHAAVLQVHVTCAAFQAKCGGQRPCSCAADVRAAQPARLRTPTAGPTDRRRRCQRRLAGPLVAAAPLVTRRLPLRCPLAPPPPARPRRRPPPPRRRPPPLLCSAAAARGPAGCPRCLHPAPLLLLLPPPPLPNPPGRCCQVAAGPPAEAGGTVAGGRPWAPYNKMVARRCGVACNCVARAVRRPTHLCPTNSHNPPTLPGGPKPSSSPTPHPHWPTAQATHAVSQVTWPSNHQPIHKLLALPGGTRLPFVASQVTLPTDHPPSPAAQNPPPRPAHTAAACACAAAAWC